MILTTHQFEVAQQLIYLKWNWTIIHSYIRKLIIRQVSRTWPCLPSGVSTLQSLAGPIVLRGQLFFDTPKLCIKGFGYIIHYIRLHETSLLKCKYLVFSANYHVLSLKVIYLYSHLLLV